MSEPTQSPYVPQASSTPEHERLKARAESRKSQGKGDNVVSSNGNTRSIISPSGILQAIAAPFSLAANGQRAKELGDTFGKISQIENGTSTTIENLRERIDARKAVQEKITKAVGTREPQIVKEILSKEEELQAAVGDAWTTKKALQSKLAGQKVTRTTLQEHLDRAREGNPIDEYFTERRSAYQIRNANKRIRAIQSEIREINTPVEGIYGEVKDLKDRLRTLRKAPNRNAARIQLLEEQIAAERTTLPAKILKARGDRVTEIGELLPGKGGVLTRAAAKSDGFSGFASGPNKFLGKIGSSIADFKLFGMFPLGEALSFIGRVLTPITAAFAGMDCAKSIYDAFTADEKDKNAARIRAVCNSVLTIGAGILGAATGGWFGLMLRMGLGNMGYTLANSVVNHDFKKMFSWLWGTA